MTTTADLHYAFYLATSKIGGNDRRSFSVSEVDHLLNKAQRVLMNQNVGLFELDSNKTHELASLHVKYPLQPKLTPITHPTIPTRNGVVYMYEINLSSLTQPYFSFTNINAYQLKNNCANFSRAVYLDNDDYSDALDSTFGLDENTIAVNMGRSTTDENPALYLYSASPLQGPLVQVEYIKVPRDMNFGAYQDLSGNITTVINPELPPRMLDKLVDLAVAIAYAAISDSSYQLKKDALTTLS